MTASGKHRPMGARELVLLALLGALLLVTKLALAWLPNIEPVSLLVLVYTAVLGWKALAPVYVYVIPQLAHNDVSAETMEKIAAACKNVVGVKYSFADMRRINDYLQVRGGNFSVVPGADDLFLPCLACGCDGVVSGCSGPFPEAFVNVYKAFQSGDLAAARKAQVEATKLVKVMQFGGDMSIFKNILTFRGVPGGHMRKPLMDLDEADVAKLKETVAPYL